MGWTSLERRIGSTATTALALQQGSHSRSGGMRADLETAIALAVATPERPLMRFGEIFVAIAPYPAWPETDAAAIWAVLWQMRLADHATVLEKTEYRCRAA